MKISNKKNKALQDFDAVVKELLSKHENIGFANIGEYMFIYKPLNRKAYRNVSEDVDKSQIEREDIVCQECVLWPENFDFDECEAAVPSLLYKEIMKNSYLDNAHDIANLIEFYRQKTNQLDSQMTCIISEAFPMLTIDEIESWDMIKFCKTFTEAEYKLRQLRNFELNVDVVDILRQGEETHETQETEAEDNSSKTKEELQPKKAKNNNTVKVGNKEMTEEQYREYQEMIRNFPEIDWGQDAMFTGYETLNASTVPPALR